MGVGPPSRILLWQSEAKKSRRVNTGLPEVGREMQMRPRRATRGADGADGLASLHAVTCFHVCALKVEV